VSRLVRLAQRVFVGSERALARKWQGRVDNTPSPGRSAFLRALSIIPDVGTTVLASAWSGGRWRSLGLPTGRLLACHAGIAGGTGTGKTSLLIGITAQIAREDRYPVILFDAKGEFADKALKLLPPVLLEAGVPEDRLARLRVVKVFDPQYVPLLNVTLPEPGVPKEAQAYGVASAVEQALAEPLGGRMHHLLVRGSALAIELGLPITELQRWLDDPGTFQRAAQRSSDPAIREYARTGFPKENRESLRALAARLNALLFWPGARQALCAPGSISFADALAEPGLTIVHVGDAPSGAERLSKFFGALLLGKIVRAILSRPVTGETPSAWFVAEEIQECMGPEEARQISRLLSTARFRKVGVWMTGQSRSQLHAVDPGLVAAMRTNLTIQAQFRTSPEDAAAFAHMLPESDERHRRDLMQEMTRLPQRHFYLAVRDLGETAELVVAPKIDFAALEESARLIPAELRERIRQGIAAVPRGAPESPAEVVPVDEEPSAFDVPPPDDRGFPRLG
jgi:uncharacterized protein DUF87